MKSPNRCAEIAVEPATGPAVLERLVAEAVVGGALLRILQRLVGDVDLLEAGFRFRIVRISVGMELHRELAIGGLQRLFVDAAVDPEHVIEIPISHPCLKTVSACSNKACATLTASPARAPQR